MKTAITMLTIALAAVLGIGVLPAWGQSAEELEKVQAALPAAARVVPSQPRKVLVFNLCRGYAHEAIGIGAKTLELMGDKTGAYSVVVSDDVAMFEPENLNQFDAVCFNNSTGNLFMPHDWKDLAPDALQKAREYEAVLQKSLLDFVRGGKGVIGIHAATDAFYEWADYGEMMGGYFWGHPWNEEVAVKIDDPLHALTAAFDASFVVADEIYQFKEPYSRDNLRVLLSLDVAKTNMNKGSEIHRTDGDFAVAWVRSYGQGRVYYCSLGHRPEIFWNPKILQFYLDGIQFALGDLPADTVPSAHLSAEYVKQCDQVNKDRAMDQALREVSVMEYGDSVPAAQWIRDRVHEAESDAQAKAALAARLAETLKGKGLSAAGKRYLAEQLSLCASENEAEVFAAMLEEPESFGLGLYGLERIPGAGVDDVLCNTLKNAGEDQQIAIANTLGKRGSEDVVPPLAKLMNSSKSPAVAHAAAEALGKIGGRKALRALARTGYASDRLYADAYLVAAGDLLESGDARGAAKHYAQILKKSEIPDVKWAAFAGMATAQGSKSVPAIIEALSGGDADLQQAAIHCVREIGDAGATEAFAARLSELAPVTQAQLIAALSDRGDRRAGPAVLAVLQSTDDEVRLAAINAIARLGDAAAVMPLAEIAATAKGAEREAARTSLSLLQGSDVNAAIQTHISTAPARVCEELIRSTVPRVAVNTVPVLLETAKSDDKDVREQSYKALSVLAGPAELPRMAALLAAMSGGDGCDDAEKAVSVISRKIDDANARAGAVLDVLSQSTDANTRVSLLRTLGQIGSPDALVSVRAAVTDGDAAVREAAVRALAGWPDSAPLDDLLRLSAEAGTETLRVLSLRGALRMLEEDNVLSGKPSFRQARSLQEDLDVYKRAMKLAGRIEEKRTALAGLANVPIPAVTAYVKTFANDPALKEEAAVALTKLSGTAPAAYASHNGEAAKHVLDGKPETAWESQTVQRPGMWLMVDLGQPESVRKLTVRAPGWPAVFIRHYEVYVSTDQKNWTGPVATGDGKLDTEITFEPRTARFVAIQCTGEPANAWWAAHTLEIE